MLDEFRGVGGRRLPSTARGFRSDLLFDKTVVKIPDYSGAGDGPVLLGDIEVKLDGFDLEAVLGKFRFESFNFIKTFSKYKFDRDL